MKFSTGILFLCIIAMQVVVSTEYLSTEYLSTEYLSTEYLSTEYLSTEYLDKLISPEPETIVQQDDANNASNIILNQQNPCYKKNKCCDDCCNYLKKIIVQYLPYSEEKRQPTLAVHVAFNFKWTKPFFNARRPMMFKFSDYLGLIFAYILGSMIEDCQLDTFTMDLWPGFALSWIATTIAIPLFHYASIIVRIFCHTIGKIIFCCDRKKSYNKVVLYGTEILIVFGMLTGLYFLTQCKEQYCVLVNKKHFDWTKIKLNLKCPCWKNLAVNFFGRCVKDQGLDIWMYAVGWIRLRYFNASPIEYFTWEDFKKSNYHIPKLNDFIEDHKVDITEKLGMPRQDGCYKNREKFGIEYTI